MIAAALFAAALAASPLPAARPEPAPVVRYVDCVAGIDPCELWDWDNDCSGPPANDGLTPETAVRSILYATALGATEVRILPAPGANCGIPRDADIFPLWDVRIVGPGVALSPSLAPFDGRNVELTGVRGWGVFRFSGSGTVRSSLVPGVIAKRLTVRDSEIDDAWGLEGADVRGARLFSLSVRCTDECGLRSFILDNVFAGSLNVFNPEDITLRAVVSGNTFPSALAQPILTNGNVELVGGDARLAVDITPQP